MHSNSLWMFERHALDAFADAKAVLEIGPTGFPSAYHDAVLRAHSHRDMRWDTIDITAQPGLTYTALSEYRFPIEDGMYDVVVSGNVIEHVRKIWVWMHEVARVCRIGGTVITLIPVSWPFHEYPIDCWRAYPEGMKALHEDAGLRVLLSTWGSIEAERYARSVPGRTPGWWLKQPWRRLYRLAGRLGWPVECAYDTITIARKEAAT
jgi:SAM-dependent methyltransferase